MSSIVIGLVIGYIAAWFMGIIDFSSIQSYGGFNLPMPFRYGLDFDLSTIIALGLIFMITAIEHTVTSPPTPLSPANRWKETPS